MLVEALISLGLTGLVGFLANRLYFSGGVCMSKNRLDGKIAIITGSNTGIGYETALDFAQRGAHVIMACRDMKKAEKAANKIINLTGNKKIDVEYLDLSDLDTVRSFASKILNKYDKLDLLVNNAGIMQCPYWISKQGYEMQLAVNHLGHFLLTDLLLDLLKKSGKSRILNVSSVAHKRGKINWDDINGEKSYSPIKAYYQTKLANILFTKELAERLKGSQVTAISLHPGLVRTEILRHSDTKVDIALAYIVIVCAPIWWMVSKSPKEGSQTTIFCAVDDEVPNHNGCYFSDCAISNVAPQAEIKEDAKRLWSISEKMVNIS